MSRTGLCLAVLGLVLVTSCSGGNQHDGLPSGTPQAVVVRTPDRPSVGGCHQIAWQVFLAETAPTDEVDCSVPHTSQTVYVGDYPTRLATRAKRFDAVPILAYAEARCIPKVAAYLGTDRGTLSQSLFSQTVFFADATRFAKGEHWFRCDVALAEIAGKTLLPLPQAVRDALSRRIPDAYVGCIQTDFRRREVTIPTIACSESHTARPVGAVRLGAARSPYPSASSRQSVARSVCLGQVRRWSRRAHVPAAGWVALPPSRVAWKLLGARQAVCYAVTPS